VRFEQESLPFRNLNETLRQNHSFFRSQPFQSGAPPLASFILAVICNPEKSNVRIVLFLIRSLAMNNAANAAARVFNVTLPYDS
jgi:hypothetical protein